MSVYQLLYISKASEDVNDSDVSEILEISRNNNKKIDVTGILVFYKDQFIQVLEGEREDVQALFEKIKKDKRHYSVAKILEDDIEERNFASWSMAFKSLGENEAQQADGFSQFLSRGFTNEVVKSDLTMVQKFLITLKDTL